MTESFQGEEFFAQLIDSAMDAVVAVDGNYRIVLFNPAAAQLFQYNTDQILGKSLDLLIPDDFRDAHRRHVEQFRNSHATSRRMGALGEVRGLRADGKELLLEASLARGTRDGQPLFTAFLRDITNSKAAEAALQISEERWRMFIEHAPAALAMLDRDMNYIAVSRRWLSDYGLENQSIIGQCHYAIFPEITDAWKETYTHALSGKVLRKQEDCFQRADGTVQWLCWEVRPWHLGTGVIGGIVIFSEDITVRKLAEAALSSSEHQHRTLLHTLADGVFVAQNNRIVFANAALPRLLGFPLEALFARSCTEIIAPEDFTTWQALLQAGTPANPDPPRSYEVRMCCQHDGVKWVELRVTNTTYGDQPAILGVVHDISARKQMLQALEEAHQGLRELTGALQEAEETERKRIARELHDELGQQLLALRMDVVTLMSVNNDKGSTSLHNATVAIQQQIDSSIQSLRRIIADLRPPILDDLGLPAALEWLAENFTKRTGIGCTVELDTNEFRLSDNLANALFRAAQEGLTNVWRHADATEAHLQLTHDNAHVLLIVSDNGKGIDYEEQHKRHSYGLRGIYERIALLGGTFTVGRRTARPGTQLTIKIPLH